MTLVCFIFGRVEIEIGLVQHRHRETNVIVVHTLCRPTHHNLPTLFLYRVDTEPRSLLDLVIVRWENVYFLIIFNLHQSWTKAYDLVLCCLSHINFIVTTMCFYPISCMRSPKTYHWSRWTLIVSKVVKLRCSTRSSKYRVYRRQFYFVCNRVHSCRVQSCENGCIVGCACSICIHVMVVLPAVLPLVYNHYYSVDQFMLVQTLWLR